jgi:hypothetical protein
MIDKQYMLFKNARCVMSIAVNVNRWSQYIKNNTICIEDECKNMLQELLNSYWATSLWVLQEAWARPDSLLYVLNFISTPCKVDIQKSITNNKQLGYWQLRMMRNKMTILEFKNTLTDLYQVLSLNKSGVTIEWLQIKEKIEMSGLLGNTEGAVSLAQAAQNRFASIPSDRIRAIGQYYNFKYTNTDIKLIQQLDLISILSHIAIKNCSYIMLNFCNNTTVEEESWIPKTRNSYGYDTIIKDDMQITHKLSIVKKLLIVTAPIYELIEGTYWICSNLEMARKIKPTNGNILVQIGFLKIISEVLLLLVMILIPIWN